MVKFYSPADAVDLSRVEALLRKGGIEYSLSMADQERQGSFVICVAEEDVPAAEELLLMTR